MVIGKATDFCLIGNATVRRVYCEEDAMMRGHIEV
jgi:hypothetical protein